MQRPQNNVNNIVITSGDYYPASEVARILLEQRQKDSEQRIVVTARHPDRCKELQRNGAEIRQINYDDENSMTQAFRNADLVVLFTDPEQNRVQNTCRAIDAMQKANVKAVVFHSIAGAETQGRKEMNEFLEIERKVQQAGRNYVILRNSFITNWFHLWAPSVMEHGQFPLLSEKNQKLAPLCLEDLARATREIIRQGVEKHQGKTYNLTGPETVDGQQLVDQLNRALGGDAGVTYQKIGRQEMEQYLRSLRDKENLKQRFPGQPTDKQIQTLVDIMEWIASGQADFKSGDLRKITNSEGEKVVKFFERNQAEFRGH